MDNKFLTAIYKRGLWAEPQYVPLAILGIIGFPIYYFFWRDISIQQYENFWLRLLGFVICIILALNNYWPAKLKPFLPYYWFFSIFYTLSFFFAFMMFKNEGSNVWLMTLLTGLVLLIFLTDWISLAVIFLSGVGLAWLLYWLTDTNVTFPMPFFETLPTYITVLVAGAIFVHKREVIIKQQYQAMASIGFSIAHELRTPLQSISSGIRGAKPLIEPLIAGYQKAEAAGMELPAVSPDRLRALPGVLVTVENEAKAANAIINILLMNIRANQLNSSDIELSKCQMSTCIQEALDRYPFKSAIERDKINWQSDVDFSFMGDRLLVVHILFNLLKNALYAIEKAERGHIEIICHRDTETNYLTVKDTGCGIAADDLPQIFTPFFSRSYNGVGLGLPFCRLVMQAMGGDIRCRSEVGKFTEFTLTFPVIPAQ